MSRCLLAHSCELKTPNCKDQDPCPVIRVLREAGRRMQERAILTTLKGLMARSNMEPDDFLSACRMGVRAWKQERRDP